MRNLMETLSGRHFIVLSLALMLVLGGVSAAFAAPAEDSGGSQSGGGDSN